MTGAKPIICRSEAAQAILRNHLATHEQGLAAWIAGIESVFGAPAELGYSGPTAPALRAALVEQLGNRPVTSEKMPGSGPSPETVWAVARARTKP